MWFGLGLKLKLGSRIGLEFGGFGWVSIWFSFVGGEVIWKGSIYFFSCWFCQSFINKYIERGLSV